MKTNNTRREQGAASNAIGMQPGARGQARVGVGALNNELLHLGAARSVQSAGTQEVPCFTSGERSDLPAAESAKKKSKLERLEEASHQARADLHVAAAAWANFRIAHGELIACAAKVRGCFGNDLWMARQAAAQKCQAATERLADAVLAKVGRRAA